MFKVLISSYGKTVSYDIELLDIVNPIESIGLFPIYVTEKTYMCIFQMSTYYFDKWLNLKY